MQLKVKKHELRLLLQCIPILTFATLASLGSLLPSVVQFSAAVILAGQVVFIYVTKGIKKNIGSRYSLCTILTLNLQSNVYPCFIAFVCCIFSALGGFNDRC